MSTSTNPPATRPNKRGSVVITEKAVEKVVEAAAASVPGTTELGRSLDRFAGRTFPRYDVVVDDQRHSAFVEAYIAVTWPSPVTSVAERVRATIIDWVEGMTGLTVSHVNVIVGPVISDKHRVTQAVIEAAPTAPTITPISVRHRSVQQPQLKNRPGDRLSTHRPLKSVKVTPLHPQSPAHRISLQKGGDDDDTQSTRVD